MPVDFVRLVARLEELLPAGVQARSSRAAPTWVLRQVRRRVEVQGPDALLVEGWFARVRLSVPTPHGDPALVLDDATRVELPRAQFLSGDDLGPDESGTVRLRAELRGVVLDLGVRPLGV